MTNVTAKYAVAVALDAVLLGQHGVEGGVEGAYRDLGTLLARHGLVREQDGLYGGAPDSVTAVLAVQDAARRLPWFAPSLRAARLLQVGEQADLLPAVAEACREPAEGEPQHRSAARSGGLDLRLRDFVSLVALLGAAALVSVVLIRGPGPVRGPGGAVASRSATYSGLVMPSPWRTTPAIALSNYLGTPVNIDEYRGKAVLVTFLYVHCPNVCPIITSKLHTALEEMSASERREVQIIAVSVDPRGDTPSAVARFLAEHEMTGRMQYLIGSQSQLGPVWQEWYVGSSRERDPDLVAHTALVYGVTASGKIATLYQSSFAPKQIVHDVPLLART